MSDPSAEAVPERILLQTRSDYPEAFERLLGLARRELRIFDPDLSELKMNSASRVQTLTRFLRGSRTHRIYIALHDVGHVTKHCPRLIALLGRYTSAILIFQTHGGAAITCLSGLRSSAASISPEVRLSRCPRRLAMRAFSAAG